MMDSLYLHLAFEGILLPRVFGKWLAEVPLSKEEMFYLEPMNLDSEWDFFFSEPWQSSTITLPPNEFATEVSGYFACDPEGLRLLAEIKTLDSQLMETFPKRRALDEEISKCQNLLEAAKSLGASDLAVPHQTRLQELLLGIGDLESTKSGIEKKLQGAHKSFDRFIDTLVRSLVAPLTKAEAPFDVDAVHVRVMGTGQDWRKIFMRAANEDDDEPS